MNSICRENPNSHAWYNPTQWDKSEIINAGILTGALVGGAAGFGIGKVSGARVGFKVGLTVTGALLGAAGGEIVTPYSLWSYCQTQPANDLPINSKRLFEKNSAAAPNSRMIEIDLGDGSPKVKVHVFDFPKTRDPSVDDLTFVGIGGFGSHASQFKELGDLPQRGRVVLIDLPGFGYSSAMKDAQGNPDYAFDGRLRDALTKAVVQMDLKKIVWMPSSLGGPILIDSLHENEELKNRTSQLILVDSIEGYGHHTMTSYELAFVRAGALPPMPPNQGFEQLGAIKTIVENVVPDARQFPQADVEDFTNPVLGEDYRDKVLARAEYARQEMELLPMKFRSEKMADLEFPKPSCIIQGGFDGYAKPEIARQFLEHLPNSVLIYMDPIHNPFAGHTPMSQVPEDFMAIVDACISEDSPLIVGEDSYYIFKSDDNSLTQIDGRFEP